MDSRRNKLSAIAALLASALIIGFSLVILKIGLVHAPPFTLLADRLIVAFAAIVLLKQLQLIQTDTIQPVQKKKLFLLALLYPSAFFLLQNFGLNLITASEAAIIYSLIPVVTTVASALLLHEKTTRVQQIGIGLSILGMAYIAFYSFQGVSDSVSGYLLILSSLLAISLYYVFLKKSVSGISTLTVTYYLMCYGTLVTVIFYIIWILINGNLPSLQRFTQLPYFLSILYLGILSTLGTSLLITIGVRKLSPVQASIFNNMSPVFGILAGVLFMGDALERHHLIGAFGIFLGVFISLKYVPFSGTRSSYRQKT